MSDDQQLAASKTEQLESGADLAKKALAAADAVPALSATTDDEVAASDQLAESIGHLQRVIERNAQELQKIKDELKQHRESLRNILENDSQLSEAKEQAELISQQVRERKSQLQNNSQATQLKNNIKEISQQSKEIEEALSNHLLNYYAITNSTSFDTSDGDQWEFQIKAKVRGRK